MKRMEDELRQALQRHSPPEGFADRLLAKAARRPARAEGRRNRRAFGWYAWRWASVAAVVLAMIAGVRYQRIEAARGMAAKEQLVLALRITAAELQFAQEKVLEIGREGHPSAVAH
ncbi:MAG TPA: hypothetical protein VLE22_02890 [Bryobacteraceae bacterium]|nr:hypothetical protein [Bryobacteraceae bacterium]